jgi:hypothetical protein
VWSEFLAIPPIAQRFRILVILWNVCGFQCTSSRPCENMFVSACRHSFSFVKSTQPTPCSGLEGRFTLQIWSRAGCIGPDISPSNCSSLQFRMVALCVSKRVIFGATWNHSHSWSMLSIKGVVLWFGSFHVQLP